MSQSYASAGIPLDPVWQTWTPTFTNLTEGNGTVIARYVQLGKVIHARFEITFGSTTTIDGSGPTISTPVTATSAFADDRNNIGGVYILDSGTGVFLGAMRLSTIDRFQPLVLNHQTNVTYIRDDVLTSAIPMTWTTSDMLTFTATYEAA